MAASLKKEGPNLDLEKTMNEKKTVGFSFLMENSAFLSQILALNNEKLW